MGGGGGLRVRRGGGSVTAATIHTLPAVDQPNYCHSALEPAQSAGSRKLRPCAHYVLVIDSPTSAGSDLAGQLGYFCLKRLRYKNTQFKSDFNETLDVDKSVA